ncbi:MAG: DUF362 domain-containing protein [Candidatus Helarchaeota archaeon]
MVVAVQERLGEVVWKTWNYEIRRENGKLYGYELKAAQKPTESWAYIHKIEENMKDSMADAMNKIGIEKIVQPSDKVIIKVNLCGGFYKILASQTPLRAVEGLVERLRDIVPNTQIFLAEANNWGHVVDDGLLKRRGYFELCQRKGIKFLKLSRRPVVYFYFRGFAQPIQLSQALLTNRENKKIINFAPIKHHWECGVTLAAKNLYGAIADESKTKFHDYISPTALDMVIAGSARIHNPDINILGGKCVCAGQGPHFCKPTRFGYFIISNDFLAADKIGADVLGFPYKLVAHAQINERLGIWNSEAPRLPGSKVIPDSIKQAIQRHVIPPEVVKRNRTGLKFIYKTNPRLLRSLRHFWFLIPPINWIFYGRRGTCDVNWHEE